MTFNKTIQMCIFDGNPNGRIMSELSNWNGRVYKISRNDLSEFANRPDCEYTGVYFLFGKDEDNKDTVYVGEAEKMLVRLKQHLKDHNYWNDCVVVISKDNILNKAHVKYLENKFYTLAVDAKRSSIINNTVPTCSSISEFDESMLSELLRMQDYWSILWAIKCLTRLTHRLWKKKTATLFFILQLHEELMQRDCLCQTALW